MAIIKRQIIEEIGATPFSAEDHMTQNVLTRVLQKPMGYKELRQVAILKNCGTNCQDCGFDLFSECICKD